MDLYHFLLEAAQPQRLMLLIALATVGGMWWRRRERRLRLWVATGSLCVLAVISTPIVVALGLASLEWSYRPLANAPAEAGAIVVLSGGLVEPSVVQPEAVLAPDTFYRCQEAARLAAIDFAKDQPVLVSGGKVFSDTPGPPCAQVMRDFLERLVVPTSRLIVEDQSRNTYENAVNSARLLRERGITRVVLVTEASHMRRAQGCFLQQGIEVVPAPCQFRAPGLPWTLSGFLPNPATTADAQRVAHEWLGWVWYRLQGRL